MNINRFMKISTAGLAAILFVFSPPLFAEVSPAEQQLNAVMDDYWNYVLNESPLTATNAGVSDFNDRLGSVTPESNARRLDAEKLFLARTRDIDRTTLSQSGLVNVERVRDGIFDLDIQPILKEKAADSFHTEFSRFLTEQVNILLYGISDENQCRDL